jgi:hypothetical protein
MRQLESLAQHRRGGIVGVFDDLSGILKQYTGTAAANPGPAVADHFDQVSSAVPASSLAEGVAHALNTTSAGAGLGQTVSQTYAQSSGDQKAGILNTLVASVGALTASRVLGSTAAQALNSGSPLSAQHAQDVSPTMVQQLADQAAQSDNSVVNKMSAFYAQHPTLVKGLGASAMALVMSKLANRRA